MVVWWPSLGRGYPLDGPGGGRFLPGRWLTPVGILKNALLRQRDPDWLSVAGRRCLARDEWERHRAQARDFVLVASRPLDLEHRIPGTVDLHGEDGAGNGG